MNLILDSNDIVIFCNHKNYPITFTHTQYYIILYMQIILSPRSLLRFYIYLNI